MVKINNVSFDAEPFIGEDGRYHYIYLITNLVNGKYYKGVHSTYNLNDGYSGSGVILNEAKEKYEIENFSKTFVKFFKNREDALYGEYEYITEEDVKSERCYNVGYGGYGSSIQRVTVYDENGNTKSIPLELYNSGDYIHINNGKSCYYDKEGNKVHTVVDDERVLSGELVPIMSGRVIAKTEDGDIVITNTEDERFKNGFLCGINKGKVTMMDRNGNTMQVDCSDERIATGELVGPTTGMFMALDVSTGEKYYITRDDERYLSGQLIGLNEGRFPAKDEFGNIKLMSCNCSEYLEGKVFGNNKNTVAVVDDNGKIIRISNTDERWTSGQLQSPLKGKVMAKDKNGKGVVVDLNDPRLKSGELVGLTKGKVKAINTLTGEKEYVSCSDERFLTGELVSMGKGKVTVYNTLTGEKEYVLCSDERIATGEVIKLSSFTKRMIDESGKVLMVNLLGDRYKNSTFYEIPTSDEYVHCTTIKGEEYYVLKDDERLKNKQLFEYIRIVKRRNSVKRNYGNRYKYTSIANLLLNLNNGWKIAEDKTD